MTALFLVMNTCVVIHFLMYTSESKQNSVSFLMCFLLDLGMCWEAMRHCALSMQLINWGLNMK